MTSWILPEKGKPPSVTATFLSLAGKPYQQFVYGIYGTVPFGPYLSISPLHKAMPNYSDFHRLKGDFLLSPRLHCFSNVTQAKGEGVNLTVGFCVIAPVLLHQAVYQHSHLIIVQLDIHSRPPNSKSNRLQRFP